MLGPDKQTTEATFIFRFVRIAAGRTHEYRTADPFARQYDQHVGARQMN
jgi:hypothetical protein